MYFERSIVNEIKKYLDNDLVLLITGARQVGKTTAMKQIKSHLEAVGQSCHYFTLEDIEYRVLLKESPKNLFRIIPPLSERKVFVFIDEVQYLDDPASFLKYLYDEHKSNLKLIVSGSSSFYIDKKFGDSLSGRKKIFELLPLSFKEFLVFKNMPELAGNLNYPTPLITADKLIPYLMEFLLYGGYPAVVLADLEEKKEILREIAYSYIKKDIGEAGFANDELYYRMLKMFSSQSGSLLNVSEVSRTLKTSRNLIEHALYVMQKSFHVTLISPFYSNVRKELTKAPKIYMSDTGLMSFFLNSFEPVDVRNDKGAILETAVLRALQLNSYVDEIKYWRTADGQEVDFVVPESETAFEVKYSASSFKEKQHRAFIEKYPDFSLKVVTLAGSRGKEKRESLAIWNL
ncbi:MAG: ATP-binding protein [bacterium]